MSTDSFLANADAWLSQQDYVGDNHPAVFGLRQAAMELDAKWTTSLWAEYNKTIRYIESLKPEAVETKEPDPLLSPVVNLEKRGV